jgi:hypothetical protein
LRGSRPFVINGTTLPANQTTYSGTITSFTDATGAPGRFPAALNQPVNEMGCVAGLIEYGNSICVQPSTVGCTDNTLNLGTVSFAAGTTITIAGNGVSQIWSRPVTATGCQTTTFNGGSAGSSNADCRTNPDYEGDLFSGCAVLRYAEQLCPPPWRIPALTDLRNLATALEIPPTGTTGHEAVEKLTTIWDAQYAGICDANGNLIAANCYGSYWYGRYAYEYPAGTHRLSRLWVNGPNDGGFGVWGTHILSNNALRYGGTIRCVRD